MSERAFIAQAIDGSILAVSEAVQQVGIGGERQVAQDLRQIGGADFAGSARAVRPHVRRSQPFPDLASSLAGPTRRPFRPRTHAQPARPFGPEWPR